MRYLSFSLSLLLLLSACQNSRSSAPAETQGFEAQQRPRQQSIEAHREFMRKEQISIEEYIKERKMAMQRSGTGIYYNINCPDSLHRQETARPGDAVYFHYRISLLQGREIYASGEEPAVLRVEREDAEIGLHEALQLLPVGCEGGFVLPSHRAFGVAGDQNEVPPFTALLYELEVLSIDRNP